MIPVPATLEIIGESAFKGCIGLESCLTAENATLLEIENEAFSGCRSLSSFDIPGSVEGIGEKCFQKCISLHRLGFVSGESLKEFVDDLTLDEALTNLGFDEFSVFFRIKIEIDEGKMDFEFPGWSSVGDELSHFILVHDLP
jgi:hypothetical protein